MSVSVSRQAGSFESVNGRQRCGIRPCACQTAHTVEAATPHSLRHRPQRPVGRRVRRRGVGQPDGLRHLLRSRRRLARRARLVPQKSVHTVFHRSGPASARHCIFALPVSLMMAIVPNPSSLRRTMRARQTCFCGLFGSGTTAPRRRRSSEVSVNETPGRILQTSMIDKSEEHNNGYTCNDLSN